MDTKKRKRYEAIVQQVIELAGGKKNILGIAHCATRLRLVLEDNDSADLKNMENVDLVKGVFVAGDQVQIIFGAGLVNDICQVLGETLHMDTMSLGDLKTKAGQKMNFLQKALKALSDVFIEIMPGILAAALLTGLSSVLGNMKAVESNETLYGIARLINISSGAIFGFLPLCVAYSAVKRFGGRPIMGIVIGCIMLSGSLADAYAAAQGTVEVTTLHIFGLGVDLVGFQGGIIVALLMGLVTAKLDIFFERKVPEVIRLLVSPLLTTLVSSFLLFLLIGPIGRGLASGITNVLVWMTRNLGIFGYAAFSGVQQLIVITGLHHVFGAIESQLLVDTGRNFLNPLMSVAIIAQGGAALGFGTTVVPGIALADPAHHGYMNYVIAHVVALGTGFLMTLILGTLLGKKKATVTTTDEVGENIFEKIHVTERKMAETQKNEIAAYADGVLIPIEEVDDDTFAQKVLGDGIAIIPENGNIYAPFDAEVVMVMDTGHAIGLMDKNNNEFLIHIGINTVNLNGKYFDVQAAVGDQVKMGDILVTEDIEKIKAEGYDMSVMLIATDANGRKIEKESPGKIKKGEKIAELV